MLQPGLLHEAGPDRRGEICWVVSASPVGTVVIVLVDPASDQADLASCYSMTAAGGADPARPRVLRVTFTIELESGHRDDYVIEPRDEGQGLGVTMGYDSERVRSRLQPAQGATKCST